MWCVSAWVHVHVCVWVAVVVCGARMYCSTLCGVRGGVSPGQSVGHERKRRACDPPPAPHQCRAVLKLWLRLAAATRVSSVSTMRKPLRCGLSSPPGGSGTASTSATTTCLRANEEFRGGAGAGAAGKEAACVKRRMSVTASNCMSTGRHKPPATLYVTRHTHAHVYIPFRALPCPPQPPCLCLCARVPPLPPPPPRALPAHLPPSVSSMAGSRRMQKKCWCTVAFTPGATRTPKGAAAAASPSGHTLQPHGSTDTHAVGVVQLGQRQWEVRTWWGGGVATPPLP